MSLNKSGTHIGCPTPMNKITDEKANISTAELCSLASSSYSSEPRYPWINNVPCIAHHSTCFGSASSSHFWRPSHFCIPPITLYRSIN
jgi:hypothetical protein